ncbi:gliding motility-associated C-terminal domain-containing protein [Panacibacter sp. DH6]|uniref:Gliding motility-associated C-terminal domain-containing protein n=1 Tax=Panacibacter microcysteis TaxID=2793269 RepID=A0A931EBF0_9BACT|nr:gliding motility-associated C-terminal domain-containing protein [Panacibacter microcysteis]
MICIALALPVFGLKAQTCGSTWLNVTNYNGGVTIGDLDITGDKITIEAKFNRSIPYTRGRLYAGDLVSKHTDPINTNYLLRPNSAEITTENGYFVTPPVCEIEINKTYHVALVYDGTTLKFYRNGFLMSRVSASGALVQNNLLTTIGDLAYLPGYAQESLVGYIDEVKIWGVARSQSQIRAYMNQALPNPSAQAGLLAYYTFNDLKNKQGNTLWDARIFGNANLQSTNPTCATYASDSCSFVVTVPNSVEADFSVPDSVCINEPININNLTKGGTNFYWNFCVADINQTPVGENLGNLGGELSQPVFMDFAKDDNGDYYGFSINHIPGQLIRYRFGNSLLNTPVVENLGNYNGDIPNQAEGVQIVQANGKWYIVVVGGGNGLPNSSPRVVVIDFGSSMGSVSQISHNWGNLGLLDQPIDLHVFNEGNNWYGFTVNALNNTITRFDFSNNFDVAPTAINLGDFGLLNYPDGIYAVNDNNFWRVFITNGLGNTITRLDFGSSLLNTPVPVDLGNPGNTLITPRDMLVVKFCDSYTGFIVNANTDEIIKLDFGSGFDQIPTAKSLGNIANFDKPHSLSKLFRVNQDIYSFITNADNNAITRLKFSGCTNSNTPNSADSLPPPVTYNAPGIYNINLMVDEGLPTQTSLCKSITVVPSPAKSPIFDTAFCSSDSIVLSTTFPAPYTWNTAVQNDSITIKQAGIYWVETNYYGCVVRDSINVINAVSPAVNLGADTAICRLDSLLINAGNAGASFLWNTGSASQSILADSAGTYIVHVKNSGGCTSSDTLVLANHAAIALKVTSDTTLCTGSSLMLQANGNNVQTYAWLPDNTLTDISISNPVASPNDTTRYYVSATDIYGCIESDSVLINVAALPSVAAMADTGICAGSSIILANSATQGVKYLWSPSGGLSSGVDPSPIATPAANTTYTVTVTTGAGCTATDSVVIAVNPLPAVTASTSDTLICVGSTAVVSAISPGVVSYNWFPPSDLANPISPVTVASPKTNTNYVVEVTDNNGCKIKDSVQVSVKPLPVFAVTPSTSGVCKGESVTLTASGGDEYAWSPTAGLTVFDKPVVVATPEVSTKYQAIITDNICNMADTLFAVVNITSLSNITVTKSNDIDCIIGTTNLRATGGLVYNWSPGTYLSDSTIATPVAAPLQTTTYHVKVSNTLGCTGSDSVTVNVYKGRVENGYKMPGAFTPNGDGNNDCFNVRKWGTLTGLDFSVYDRWGKLIFHTNNASDCWDGTYKGQLQPPGAYVYQVRAQALCGTVYRKGTVVLIR